MASINRTVPKGTTYLSAVTIAATDSLLFGEGGQGVITTIDQSAVASGLTNVLFDAPFTGDIGGGSAGYFKAYIQGLMTMAGGGGSVYYQPAGAANTCARIKQIGSQKLVLGGGGTVTNMEQSSSTVECTDLTYVTDLWQIGGSGRYIYVAQANAFVNAIISGGSFASGRGGTNASTLTVCGSAYATIAREDSQTGNSPTLPSFTTVNVFGPGAVLDWRGGAITTLNVFGGARWNASNSLFNATIGTVNVDAASLRVSNFYSPKATLTYTTKNVRGATIDTLAF